MEKPTNGDVKKAVEDLDERDAAELLQLEAVQKRINGRGQA